MDVCTWTRIFLITVVCFLNVTDSVERKVRGRKKRYLTYPEGAIFVMRMAINSNLIGVTYPTAWGQIIELDLAYPLHKMAVPPPKPIVKKKKKPPPPKHHPHHHGHYYDTHELHFDPHEYPPLPNEFSYKPHVYNHVPPEFGVDTEELSSYHNRRHRRDVYDEMKELFSMQGQDGQSCILRAFCEVKHILTQVKQKTLVEEIMELIFTIPAGNDEIFASEGQNFDNLTGLHDCQQWSLNCNYSLLDLIVTGTSS